MSDKELAVVDALDIRQIQAFALADEAAATIETLHEHAAEHSGLAVGEYVEDLDGAYAVFQAPAGGWLHRAGDLYASADLAYSDADLWSLSARPEPCFAAGYSLSVLLHPVLAADRAWIERLAQDGYTCTPLQKYVCVYRVMAMSDLLDGNASLDAQARALGSWTAKAIADLAAHDPGELDLPSLKRRAKRRS